MSSTTRFAQNLSKGILGKPDPEGVWHSIISYIPDEILAKPNVKILNVAFGHLTEAKVLVKRMRALGKTAEEIKDSIYLIDKYRVFCADAKEYGYKHIIHADFLTHKFNMKFDVIVMNPPYQKGTGNKGQGQTLWNLFVDKAINELLNDGGAYGFITPAGWRALDGSFKNTQKTILDTQITSISINNITDGQNTFGVSTRFDYYTGIKTSSKELAYITDENQNTMTVDMATRKFLPNFDIDFIDSLIAKDGEEKVEVINERSMYPLNKVKTTKDNQYNLPCVKYIHKGTEVIDFVYTDKDKGMFGKPKVMFGIMAQVGGIILDEEGKYGMCQYTAGIVDTKENLPLIQKALKSDKFRAVMRAVQFTTQEYNVKVIKHFRKDFWKEFV